MADSNTLLEIEDGLRPRFQKWGWIVYRTTYADDEKWAKFNEVFQSQVRDRLLNLDGGEHHCQFLDYTVRSNKAKYEGATAAQLRAEFREWRSSSGPLVEQGLSEADRQFLVLNARYSFFIRVTEEAMQSVLDGAEQNDFEESWVDVVHVDWLDHDDADADADASGTMQEDGWPPIEGITSHHVGFQRVEIEELYPDCWHDFHENPWDFYMRPPQRTYDYDSMGAA
jgi:hypothetical protein